MTRPLTHGRAIGAAPIALAVLVVAVGLLGLARPASATSCAGDASIRRAMADGSTERGPSARVVAQDRTIQIVGELPDPKPVDDGGGHTGNLARLLVGLGILAVAALCLYLLFRRGSIADRAKVDVPDP